MLLSKKQMTDAFDKSMRIAIEKFHELKTRTKDLQWQLDAVRMMLDRPAGRLQAQAPCPLQSGEELVESHWSELVADAWHQESLDGSCLGPCMD